jgi:tetratricopeptide (TPR) repeat protein
MSTPGAARIYWEEAIRKQPTQQRLLDLTKHLVWLSNWQDALPYATRLVETYPGHAEGHYLRARINASLGNIPEARKDYYMAAALGHDLALQELIMAHIRGGLGLPAKSFEDTVPLCRYGASLGSAVGANCMGSMYNEAASVGLPLRQDIPQSFAWHLLGARAGHYNSQYDLGWLLYTGRGPGVKPDLAESNGVFWMRRAAEQNHRFAKQKLEELQIPLSEEPASGSWDTVLNVLHSIIQILL